MVEVMTDKATVTMPVAAARAPSRSCAARWGSSPRCTSPSSRCSRTCGQRRSRRLMTRAQQDRGGSALRGGVEGGCWRASAPAATSGGGAARPDGRPSPRPRCAQLARHSASTSARVPAAARAAGSRRRTLNHARNGHAGARRGARGAPSAPPAPSVRRPSPRRSRSIRAKRRSQHGDEVIPFAASGKPHRRAHGAVEAHRGALHLRGGGRRHRPGGAARPLAEKRAPRRA